MTYYFSITKVNMLMTFRKITAVYFKNNFKHEYIVWENVYLFLLRRVVHTGYVLLCFRQFKVQGYS